MPDVEHLVLRGIALVEGSLDVGRERCDGAEREADRVGVAGGEPGVYRYEADLEVAAPVGSQARVDAAVSTRLHDRHELIEIMAVARVGRSLHPNQLGAVPVVRSSLRPGGREHSDAEQDDGGAGYRCGPRRRTPAGGPVHDPQKPREPDAGHEDTCQVDSHHEAVNLDVAESGQKVEHRPKRRPAEEEHQAEGERAQHRPGSRISPGPR
jgi:hypothetical protein